MKKLLFIITLAFLISGCSKLKQFYFKDVKVSGVENTKEEPKSPFEIDELEYRVYGKIRPFYELGYDDNYHAYLTDMNSKIQIVFLCSSYYTDYMKEDFLNHYDEAIKENRDLEDAFSYVIEWCIEKASKHEVVWSNHFNCDIERYYVSYNIAQGLFHI